MDKSFINRDIAIAISEAVRYFPVITITGPRQSGKTTLLKQIFASLPYYSLETPDIQDFAIKDPVAFLQRHPEGMALDEVQQAPALLSYIQGMVDEHPEKRFVLSGSSHFSMLRTVTQSLAGRTAIFELLPFSYREIEQSARQKTLDELLLDGFYPAIYAGKNKPQYLYPNYVKTYIERDVRDLLQVKDLKQFRDFLRLCASRIGQLFNASELSNEIGIAVNTVKSWLSVLQTSYIVVVLPPFYENRGKRLVKAPKIYFTDTGLACYLLDIDSSQQLARDKMRGALFENLVVAEALKNRYNAGKDNNLLFYRDSAQNEVDLLARTGERYHAVEIKSSQTYHTDFEKGLNAFQKIFAERVADKTIVYAGDYENLDADTRLIGYNSKSFNEMMSEI